MSSLNQLDRVGIGGPDDGHWELADTAGIQWVRRVIRWYQVEGDINRFPSYDWSGYDDLFGDLRNHTYPFEIMAILGAGTPTWAADSTCWDPDGNGSPDTGDPPILPRNCPPADQYMDDFRDFVAVAADRYDYIDYWEAWNEAYDMAWDGGDPLRYFFKDTVPELVEIIDTIRAGLNSEDSIVCCGFPRSGDSNGVWTAEKMLDLTSNIDIVSTHCYGNGPACVSKENALRDELESEGYSDVPQWMTEGYHTADPKPDSYHSSTSTIRPTDSDNKAWISSFDALARDSSWFGKYFMFRWAQTPAEWHEHPSLPADSTWHVHSWNYLVIEQDTSRNFLGLREASFCALAHAAGNESSTDVCPDVTGISGHDMGQTVPPSTICTHAATGETGGSTPYLYDWYIDDVLEKSGSEDHISVTTPSSGSYDVRIVLIDDNGAEAWYQETMTVDSNAMCPQ